MISRRKFIRNASTGLMMPTLMSSIVRGSVPLPLSFWKPALASASDSPTNYSLVGWWKADSLSLADGAAVGGTGNEWTDSSGGGRTASQATAGNRPVFRTNVFGTLPTIQSNGANYLDFTNLDLVGDYTVMAFGRGIGGYDNVFIGGNVANNDLLESSGANKVGGSQAGTTYLSNTASTPLYKPRLITFVRSGTSYLTYENATDITPGSHTIGTTAVRFNRLMAALNPGNFHGVMDIAEVAVFSSALSASAVASLYTYFLAKWGSLATSALPNTITGLQLWLQADAITGLNDADPVASWTDSSGNSHPGTQATAGFKPLYKTGILNGLPIVRFDNTDDRMTTGLTVSGAVTAFVVYASNGSGRRVLDASNNWLIGPYSGSYNFYNNSFASNLMATVTGQFVVFTYRCNASTTTEHWINGVLRASVAAGVAPGTIGLGQAFNGEKADSDVAEVIIYNAAVSETDRKLVEAYLQQKWGLI